MSSNPRFRPERKNSWVAPTPKVPGSNPGPETKTRGNRPVAVPLLFIRFGRELLPTVFPTSAFVPATLVRVPSRPLLSLPGEERVGERILRPDRRRH